MSEGAPGPLSETEEHEMTELIHTEFEEDLDVYVELATERLRHVDIQLDTIEELRETAITEALAQYTEMEGVTPEDWHRRRLRKALVEESPRLATLEEVGITPTMVEDLRSAVWDIELPLLEGRNSNGNGWEPKSGGQFKETKTYEPRVKALLTMQDIALHPGLIEILLSEVHLRRRQVDERIREAIRGNRSSVRSYARDAAVEAAKNHGFSLEGEDPYHHSVISGLMNVVNSKKRGKRRS